MLDDHLTLNLVLYVKIYILMVCSYDQRHKTNNKILINKNKTEDGIFILIISGLFVS